MAVLAGHDSGGAPNFRLCRAMKSPLFYTLQYFKLSIFFQRFNVTLQLGARRDILLGTEPDKYHLNVYSPRVLDRNIGT